MIMYGGNIDLILFIIFGLFFLGLGIYRVVSSQIDKSSSKSGGKSGSKSGVKPVIGYKKGYYDMPFF
jgi:hypothetical protein